MLGGFTEFQSNAAGDFGERMINSVVTQSLRHLFSRSDSVAVAVRCSPPPQAAAGNRRQLSDGRPWPRYPQGI